jgi:hypothetical protein
MKGSFAAAVSGRRVEFHVCDEHGQRLASGEDRRLDLEHRTIEMGEDLARRDEWVATGWTVDEGFESGEVQVIVETRRLGTQETGQVRFVLPPALRRHVVESLNTPAFHPDVDESGLGFWSIG